MGDPAPTVATTQRNVNAKVQKQKTAATIRYPFWFGGSAASMAAVVTHPLDLGMGESTLAKPSSDSLV